MRVPRRHALPALLLIAVTGCTRSDPASASANEAGADDAGSSTTAPTTTASSDAGSSTAEQGDAGSSSASDAGSSTAESSDAGSSTAESSDAGSDGGGATTESRADSSWARRLAPILFRDVNTLADVALRLYKDDGSIDDAAAAEVERVLWAAKDEAPPHVSRRLLQLVVRVAAHFDAHEIQVISSHRGKARKGSRHRSGEAIDFVLPGVAAKALAEVLRTYPRVGVGVYIHPRSQFVHLDVREQSYHWVDSSPPKRSWREVPMPDPTATARDAAYEPSQDLPEIATAPR